MYSSGILITGDHSITCTQNSSHVLPIDPEIPLPQVQLVCREASMIPMRSDLAVTVVMKRLKNRMVHNGYVSYVHDIKIPCLMVDVQTS